MRLLHQVRMRLDDDVFVLDVDEVEVAVAAVRGGLGLIAMIDRVGGADNQLDLAWRCTCVSRTTATALESMRSRSTLPGPTEEADRHRRRGAPRPPARPAGAGSPGRRRPSTSHRRRRGRLRADCPGRGGSRRWRGRIRGGGGLSSPRGRWTRRGAVGGPACGSAQGNALLLLWKSSMIARTIVVLPVPEAAGEDEHLFRERGGPRRAGRRRRRASFALVERRPLRVRDGKRVPAWLSGRIALGQGRPRRGRRLEIEQRARRCLSSRITSLAMHSSVAVRIASVSRFVSWAAASTRMSSGSPTWPLEAASCRTWRTAAWARCGESRGMPRRLGDSSAVRTGTPMSVESR